MAARAWPGRTPNWPAFRRRFRGVARDGRPNNRGWTSSPARGRRACTTPAAGPPPMSTPLACPPPAAARPDARDAGAHAPEDDAATALRLYAAVLDSRTLAAAAHRLVATLAQELRLGRCTLG